MRALISFTLQRNLRTNMHRIQLLGYSPSQLVQGDLPFANLVDQHSCSETLIIIVVVVVVFSRCPASNQGGPR